MLWGVFSAVMLVIGQTDAPDYSIRSIRYEFTPDGTQVAVIFDVLNNGGAADAETTARLLDQTGSPISQATVPPLDPFETAPVRLEFPTYLFEASAGQSVSLSATVGIPDIEAAGSLNAGDNTARISVPIPILNVATPEVVPGGEVQVAPPSQGAVYTLEDWLRGVLINVLGVDIDSRILIIGIVVGLGIALLLLWIVLTILRVLFTRPVVFPLWQPPYSTTSYIDPNSLAGRRILWQPHAGSDLLPVPCQPGAFAARKVLVGTQGGKLHGWRVTGLRLNQYDMYGRVARSQVIAESRWVKRLNRAAKRSASLDAARAERRARPIARHMTRELRKRVHKRSMMLPIAMDVRLDGRHGDIRIVFELHQCDGSGYTPIDTWEPEMVVTTQGGIIRENLTYTLFGRRQDEKPRAYYRRVRMDMARTLGHLLAGATPKPPKAAAPKGGRKALPPTPPEQSSVPPETSLDTSPIAPVDDLNPTPKS
jgi:hypothetical protein